jgi:hypothetical protein
VHDRVGDEVEHGGSILYGRIWRSADVVIW